MSILRRLLKYSDKIFNLSGRIEAIPDRRKRPQIETSRVFSSALVMSLSQLGSLNALEQAKGYGCFWKKWIGGDLPSADTVGRVFSKISCAEVRDILRSIYTKLKRNKALRLSSGR